MAGNKVDSMLVVGFITLGLGLIVHIVSLSTLGWLISSTTLISIEMGLFRFCVSSSCQLYDAVGSVMVAVQALVITGSILAGFGIILAVLFYIAASKRTVTKTMGIMSGFMGVIAGLLNFCGLMVFFVNVYDPSYLGSQFLSMDPGFSFYVCIAGVVILLVGGIFIFTGTSKTMALQNQLSYGQILRPAVPTGTIVYQAYPGGMVYGQCNPTAPILTTGPQVYAPTQQHTLSPALQVNPFEHGAVFHPPPAYEDFARQK